MTASRLLPIAEASRELGEQVLVADHAHQAALVHHRQVDHTVVYDEAQGLPDEGIAPGTKWEDVPLNWRCPECGAGKEDFEMVEV